MYARSHICTMYIYIIAMYIYISEFLTKKKRRKEIPKGSNAKTVYSLFLGNGFNLPCFVQ